METRFAGSQRLDERRRRRLAAESEGIADDTPDTDSVVRLSAPSGQTRQAHRPEAETSKNPGTADFPELPLHFLVPTALWKHFAFAATILLLGGGILAANVQAIHWAELAGPGVTQLFQMQDGPATRWYASLLLLLSSQVAAIIWWGRSRSTKDFDGRYRVWTKIAAAWFLCSGGIACDVHHVWSATALWLLQREGRQAELLATFVPLGVFGTALIVALHREMRGCRLSLGIVYAVAILSVTSSLATAQVIHIASDVGQALLTEGTRLAACALLLHAMLLHARHVLYYTAEPSAAPRRRKLRIPRPHFRWPSLQRFRKAAAKVESTDQTTNNSRVRIDDKHDAAAEKPKAKSAKTPQEKPAEVVTTPSAKNRDVPPPPTIQKVAEPQATRQQIEDRDHEQFGDVDEEEPETSDYDADDNDWSDDSSSRPSPKGLSKKQRRRMLQEQRDRERGQRR